MNKIVMIAMVSLWITLPSCHKCNDPSNPQCSNYNPCYNVQATTAQFTMMEYSDTNEMDASLRQYWKFYDTDSAWQKVTFSASLDSAVYEWHIGSGVYTSQSFTLDFSSVSRPSIIPVTLIVKKQHNQKCFPDGKDADTLTRNLSIVSGQPNKYFFGTYQGAYIDAPNVTVSFLLVQDTFTISNSFIDNFYLVNFFAPGDSAQFDFGSSYNGLIQLRQNYCYRDPSCSHYFDFTIYVDDAGNAECAFAVYPPTLTTAQIRVFKGKKIQ